MHCHATPGKPVRHRSGGPRMIVVEEALAFTPSWAPRTVRTVWFDRSHNRRTATFTLDELEPAEG